MDYIVEEALSNSTILRQIFSFLNAEDLERCCHVSQFWRTVADPLVFSHFQIQLGKVIYAPQVGPKDSRNYRYTDGYWYDLDIGRTENQRESEDFVIREMDRYNRKIFTTYDSNFTELSKTLEKVLLAHKVSISLKVRAKTDEQRKCMKTFLSKYGPLVQDLSFQIVEPLPLNLFCKLLLNSLPNLRKLDCSALKLQKHPAYNQWKLIIPELELVGQNFNPDLPQNQHKHLRKISFTTFSTDAPLKVQCFATILKIAPHLDEIQGLPFELINALEMAHKGPLLKSVDYVFSHTDEVLGDYQTLAQLQPKLTSFHLLENPYPLENGNFFEMTIPLIFSILESSSQTLETLTIPSTGWRGFQNIPCLEALIRLEFGPIDLSYGLIFPAHILLTQVFPNVREIDLSDCYCELEEVLNRLPENGINPWGSQIKFLKAQYLSLTTRAMFLARFPNIEELDIFGSSQDIAEVFPRLALWPYLKSLTIRIDGDLDLGPNRARPRNLDFAFTGISQEVLDTLGDASRRGNLTDEQIQGFKDESPMRKFTELRELKLIWRTRVMVGEPFEKYTGLSPVVNEFSFKLLPHLKVTVGIGRHRKFGEVTQTALQPLSPQCDNIQVEDYDFDSVRCIWKL